MAYEDTFTCGIPNLHPFENGNPKTVGMWRTGHPPSVPSWTALASIVEREGVHTVMVQLHDDVEGDDAAACAQLGWTLFKCPMPPYDDKPLSVFELPTKADVDHAVGTILQARLDGFTVVWGCLHGRDRTGIISAIVGMRLLGWSKMHGWDDMIEHGYRWELPDLDAYWETQV